MKEPCLYELFEVKDQREREYGEEEKEETCVTGDSSWSFGARSFN